MGHSGQVDAMAAAILRCVAAIPRGQVMSYGEVARRAGFRGRARQVGRILREAGDAGLPWHRVLRADGRLGFPRDSTQWQEQHARLREEGVQFSDGRVPSSRFLGSNDEYDIDAILWGNMPGNDGP